MTRLLKGSGTRLLPGGVPKAVFITVNNVGDLSGSIVHVLNVMLTEMSSHSTHFHIR